MGQGLPEQHAQVTEHPWPLGGAQSCLPDHLVFPNTWEARPYPAQQDQGAAFPRGPELHPRRTHPDN